MNLNVKAFALTCGLAWGSASLSTFIGRLYRGYNLSPLGSLIGLVWAFVDGAIGGDF